MNKAVSATDIRVLIAEENPSMRRGLDVMLDAYEGFDLIGEAEDGEQAVRLALQLKPDVIIMELQMPVKDSVTAIQEISKLQPDIHILVLTSFPDDDKLSQAIKAGAMGCFLKEARPEQLVEAIRMVHQGTAVVQTEIAQKLMVDIKQSPPQQITGVPSPNKKWKS